MGSRAPARRDIGIFLNRDTQRSGQRRQDDDTEAVQRRGHRHNLADARLQHQDVGAPGVSRRPASPQTSELTRPASQVQAEHVGRGRPKVAAILLAELLRMHRRADMGDRQCGQGEAGGLPGRAACAAERRGAYTTEIDPR